jgi:hypothetical protein
MRNGPAWGPFSRGIRQAACSQADVSNALLIIGMFIPKEGLAPPLDLDEGFTLM